ncbi:MAG: hypothetical protein VYD54_12055 [Bdellovibrionota bacterium]|nr:hypothetical protein [Bdellovibrionota bacterium]
MKDKRVNREQEETKQDRKDLYELFMLLMTVTIFFSGLYVAIWKLV